MSLRILKSSRLGRARQKPCPVKLFPLFLLIFKLLRANLFVGEDGGWLC